MNITLGFLLKIILVKKKYINIKISNYILIISPIYSYLSLLIFFQLQLLVLNQLNI